MASPLDPLALTRCRMYGAPGGAELAEPVVAIASGPRGVRWFTARGWGDEREWAARLPAAPEQVAWTGAGYLVWNGRGLANWDAAVRTARSARPLPGHVCDVRLLEVPGGVLAIYRRTRRADCLEDEEAAPVFVQRFNSAGVPQGPATALEGLTASALDARWDAGRVVVGMTVDGSERYAILAPDGRVLPGGAQLVGEPGACIACPRAGCVRVVLREGATHGGTYGGGVLRVEVAGRDMGFEVPVAAESLEGVTVSGDRVLVRFRPRVGSYAYGESATDFVIVDVVRRRLDPVHDASTGQAVTTWRLGGQPASIRVAATPRGFALAGWSANGSGLVRRLVDCPR
jgi:hypothetical protein